MSYAIYHLLNKRRRSETPEEKFSHSKLLSPFMTKFNS